MLNLLLLLAFLPQEHHYIDGVELTLNDGTVIKTASDLNEDRLFYTWEEEGTTVSIERKKVRSIQYFSMRVKGPAPRKKTKTAVQRRISGLPVAYERKGVTFFKVMHVDARGRNADGSPVPNRVKELFKGGMQGSDHLLSVDFSQTRKDTLARFRFYSQKGQLLCQSFVPVGDPVSKDRKSKTERYNFTVPAAINLEKLGLVEVFSESQ